MDFNTLLTAIFTNGIGAVCAAAVLWFAWYRETKTIPQMMTTFADVQKVTTTSFEARNERTLETFAAVLREERTVCQKWHEENRNRLDQLILEQKEQRHWLRDMAHQLGVKQALEEERRRRGEPTE